MLRSKGTDDHRRDYLIFLLLFEISDRKIFEYREFIALANRYVAELEALEVLHHLSRDIIETHRAEIDEAFFDARSFGIVNYRPGARYFELTHCGRSRHRWSVCTAALPAAEIALAQQAAKHAYEAFCKGEVTIPAETA